MGHHGRHVIRRLKLKTTKTSERRERRRRRGEIFRNSPTLWTSGQKKTINRRGSFINCIFLWQKRKTQPEIAARRAVESMLAGTVLSLFAWFSFLLSTLIKSCFLLSRVGVSTPHTKSPAKRPSRARAKKKQTLHTLSRHKPPLTARCYTVVRYVRVHTVQPRGARLWRHPRAWTGLAFAFAR